MLNMALWQLHCNIQERKGRAQIYDYGIESVLSYS